MSSIATNQGPREGSAERDVSQIFDSPSSSSSSGAYQLPAVGNLTKTVSVEQRKKLLRKVLYPRLVSKIEKAGFAYELTTEDQSYTALEANAVPESRTSTIINITRQLDNKGKEWIWFTTVEEGYDAAGEAVIGSGTVLEHNKDKDVQIKSIRNSEGEITKLQLANVYTDIYTQEYNTELLKDILSGEKYQLSPNLSLVINEASGTSWSGMSQLEYEELDAKELIWRCKYNHCNEDLTVRFSDMTTAQKLNLSSKQ